MNLLNKCLTLTKMESLFWKIKKVMDKQTLDRWSIFSLHYIELSFKFQAVLTPKYIIWEFNGSGIGGSTYTQIDKSTTTSTLSLNWLSAQNAGVYSCKPAQLDAAIVQLFVLDSEGNQVALLNSGKNCFEVMTNESIPHTEATHLEII